MSAVKYQQPTGALIEYVADNMRAADVKEVWASGDRSPHSALWRGVEESDYSTVALIGDEPVAVFGLALHGILGRTGVPWMLGTDGVVKHKRVFVPNSRVVVSNMLDVAPSLYNYAHAENAVSIRWLKWLGFKFEDAAPYGPHGELFHRFSMEKGDV